MDDLKLYGKKNKELDGLLCTVKKFSDDIGMEFGLYKCAKTTFIRGRLTSTSEIKLNEDTSIRELHQGETRIFRNRRRRWNITCQNERKDQERVL